MNFLDQTDAALSELVEQEPEMVISRGKHKPRNEHRGAESFACKNRQRNKSWHTCSANSTESVGDPADEMMSGGLKSCQLNNSER
jgi:hypothetical protein